MKMTEGCNSLATANSARTSFSPSPTCDGNNMTRLKKTSAGGERSLKVLDAVLTYLEVKLAALMLKNVAFDSAATALAWQEEIKAVIQLMIQISISTPICKKNKAQFDLNEALIALH